MVIGERTATDKTRWHSAGESKSPSSLRRGVIWWFALLGLVTPAS
jgi:hypothetical protein